MAGGAPVPTVSLATGLACTVFDPTAASLKVYVTGRLPLSPGTDTTWVTGPLHGVAVYGSPVRAGVELNTHDVAAVTVADSVTVPPFR